MSHNRIMVAVCSIAYSVPAFQVEDGFGNTVPGVRPLLKTKCQVLEEGADYLGRTGLGSHGHFPTVTNQEWILQ